MIDIKDLRIGSLIQHNNGRAFNIVRASDLVHIEEHPDRYQGITITENYLIKMGFTQHNNDNQDSAQHSYRLEPYRSLKVVPNHSGTKEFFLVSMHMQDEQDFKPEHINYVHQLQNLVYSLTKKELTLPAADLFIA